jgi:hypothetical protein
MAFAAGIGAVGSLIGGLLGSSAAKKAAATQAASAQQAASTSTKYGAEAKNFAEEQLARSQGTFQPFVSGGTQAEMTLSDLTRTPGQGLLTPFNEQFRAPTAGEAAATPGYQFALQQGQEAIENSAAARGNLLSSTTLKGLDQYSQGLASQNYGDVYQRALGEFQQRYNIFNQNQSNQFNRLSSLAAQGQQSAEDVGQLGSTASGQVGNILLGTSGQIGNALQSAGAARASGYVGSANAWQGALGGAVNSLSTLRLGDISGGGYGKAMPFGQEVQT